MPEAAVLRRMHSRQPMPLGYSSYPTPPSELAGDTAAITAWQSLMMRFLSKVDPRDGSRLRRNRRGLRSVVHRGCGGVLARLVVLPECIVLSPLDPAGRHTLFEICRWLGPEDELSTALGLRAATSRATGLAQSGTCRKCGEEVPLGEYRSEIRRFSAG
jgi:hypothetical protein